jgi:hypothetical protein
MADELTLTTPDAAVPITGWKITAVAIDVETASIQLSLKANTGARSTWSSPLSPAALTFLNEGRFATQQGKTLQRWLLEQMVASGAKVGAVT